MAILGFLGGCGEVRMVLVCGKIQQQFRVAILGVLCFVADIRTGALAW